MRWIPNADNTFRVGTFQKLGNIAASLRGDIFL
jgi:hypothetical protein